MPTFDYNNATEEELAEQYAKISVASGNGRLSLRNELFYLQPLLVEGAGAPLSAWHDKPQDMAVYSYRHSCDLHQQEILA